MSNRKRLFFDLEVSPNIGFFWQSGHQISVGYDSIIKERAIICICYKWEGKDKVYHLKWDKNQCDKKLVQDFAKIANTADELVGHNGDRFDLKWFKTRALIHGVEVTPYITTFDTLKLAKSHFKFNSNRLDYISKLLLGVGKEESGYDLWKDICLKNSRTAMDKMIKYCKVDVIRLEQVFEKFRPYAKPKTNYSGIKSGQACPECSSERLVINKQSRLPSGNLKVYFKCNDCSTYHFKTIVQKKATKIK